MYSPPRKKSQNGEEACCFWEVFWLMHSKVALNAQPILCKIPYKRLVRPPKAEDQWNWQDGGQRTTRIHYSKNSRIQAEVWDAGSLELVSPWEVGCSKSVSVGIYSMSGSMDWMESIRKIYPTKVLQQSYPCFSETDQENRRLKIFREIEPDNWLLEQSDWIKKYLGKNFCVHMPKESYAASYMREFQHWEIEEYLYRISTNQTIPVEISNKVHSVRTYTYQRESKLLLLSKLHEKLFYSIIVASGLQSNRLIYQTSPLYASAKSNNRRKSHCNRNRSRAQSYGSRQIVVLPKIEDAKEKPPENT